MAEIVCTNTALDQLDDLAHYIAIYKPYAARALVIRAVETVSRLADFPLSGRVPDELPHSVYREIVIPPCRIFYRYTDTTVFIIHIMREERVLRAHMLE